MHGDITKMGNNKEYNIKITNTSFTDDEIVDMMQQIGYHDQNLNVSMEVR